MRVLSLYTHGLTMGTSPGSNSHQRSKRGEVTGWSHAATRRNVAFLRSIDDKSLSGSGFALTLTLRDCPDTPEAWHGLRRRFIKRLERMGLIRFHWVTEWQRRGVPHLHGAFWFPDGTKGSSLVQQWLKVAAEFGASSNSQHFARIEDSLGWFKYLSKHAARGVSHYQRSGANVPTEWQSKTGRVWGHGGEWSTRELSQLRLDDRGFYLLRRLIRNWRVSEARQFSAVKSYLHKHPELGTAPENVLRRLSGASRRLSQARGMLRCHSPTLSNVRGVSEWIEEDVILMTLGWLSDQGCQIES